MKSRVPKSPEFERLIAGEAEISIARVALEIASDQYASLDVESYLDQIEALADRVRVRCRPSASVRDVLAQINWVLYVEEDFQGNVDEYDDPRNSFLNDVLDRKLGIPISLAIVYQSIGRQLGLDIDGANLPMHFMLRVEDEGSPWFIDAFHSGAVLDPERCRERLSLLARKPLVLSPEMTAPCDVATLISRMLRNLRAIYSRDEDLGSLLTVQRRLAALNPDHWGELRDLGVLCVRLGLLAEGMEALQEALRLVPAGVPAGEVARIVGSLQRELARWN